MCDPQNAEWRKHTVDPTAIVIASQSSSSHARSALPKAPVVERPLKSRPARPKRAAATVLRRFAARLDPSYS
jgi:hypothetical protein